MIDDIVNDGGAENGLSASRYPIQPEERCWGGLPIGKDFALNDPSTSVGMALFLCLVVVQ